MFIYIKYLFIYIIIHFISIFLSKKYGLVDEPSRRKIHNKKIPCSSGIALYIVLLIISFDLNINIQKIIFYSSITLFVGLVDDIFALKPELKIFFMSLPIFLLIDQGYYLTNIGQYEYFGVINLGKYSFIFTFLCVNLLMNAFNYNDGVDGLGLSQFIIPLIYFTFLINENLEIKIFFNVINTCLILALIFNITNNENYKSFLGNSGSLLIGFILSFLIIYLHTIENIHPAYLIWSVSYIVYEFLAITIIRLIKKKKIFQPSKEHFHHFIFYNFKKSHIYTTFLIAFISITFITFGYLVTNIFGFIYSLLLFVLIFFIYLGARLFFYTK